MDERLGIAGSGTIACGLAAAAARVGPVLLWARSESSAQRAGSSLQRICARIDPEADLPSNVSVVTDLEGLAPASFLVEAVREDMEAKRPLLGRLGELADEGAVIATTTSSLSVGELARASGRPHRFVGFHVFNPVPRMELVELAFTPEAEAGTRSRAHALCLALGKTPVEVPDVPGFVVNRLLFPYLFNAVELLEATGLEPEQIDACMSLGAGHPMGPLKLLDLVGLDVAQAIGEAIGAEVPERVRALAAEGAVGRKVKRGFYLYE